jgi:hypothetical protein
MTLSERIFYFLAISGATKQGRIYVYGELKLELQSDLEVLCDDKAAGPQGSQRFFVHFCAF